MKIIMVNEVNSILGIINSKVLGIWILYWNNIWICFDFSVCYVYSFWIGSCYF